MQVAFITCTSGEVTDTFAIPNGVKHGCLLVPTLDYIFPSAMLKDDF